MKILVMGAGALGGYFGARLDAAGHEVTYVARGAHLEAMQKSGLRVESGAGDLTLPEVHAVADPADSGEVDAVLFMVKNYDVESAAAQLAPVLHGETIVVTCQNGVSAPERLGRVIGADRVCPGAVYMPADIKEPGVIRHPETMHRIVFGALDKASLPRAEALAEAIRASGPDCEIHPAPMALLWEKFVMLSSLSAITALTRLNLGPIRETPRARDLLERAVAESEAVGHAVCPEMSADAGARALKIMLETLGPHVHASMLDDLNRGKRIELNHLSGEIERLGRLHGIPTPVHSMVTDALQPFVNGAP